MSEFAMVCHCGSLQAVKTAVVLEGRTSATDDARSTPSAALAAGFALAA